MILEFEAGSFGISTIRFNPSDNLATTESIFNVEFIFFDGVSESS